ncbi:hypothetical protein [Nonomuraea sp. NPDC049309]|uniref:hypothetical protein n=1 Tax=Nonomuraea sp. NPDC049309 TaxID=3364350 RepID=UPI0037236735
MKITEVGTAVAGTPRRELTVVELTTGDGLRGLGERTPACANGRYQGERDPGSTAEQAAGVVTKGYRGLKTDPFGAATAEPPAAQPPRTCDILTAVRAAAGSDMEPAAGCFAPPAEPGRGVTLDRQACTRHPRTNAHFTLVRDGWERRDGHNMTEVGA